MNAKRDTATKTTYAKRRAKATLKAGHRLLMLRKPTARQIREGIELVREAANQGLPEAQFALARLFITRTFMRRNLGEYVRWNKRAALQGHIDSMFNLALYYDLDRKPQTAHARKQAFLWYQKAANAGDIKAQNNLGSCYCRGEGVRRNYKLAALWYRRAAEAGDDKGAYNLGLCYRHGEGVKRNATEAEKWLIEAIGLGHAKAAFELADLYRSYERIKGTPKPWLRVLRAAADMGSSDACAELARIYRRGDGVRRNPIAAESWKRKAAEARRRERAG